MSKCNRKADETKNPSSRRPVTALRKAVAEGDNRAVIALAPQVPNIRTWRNSDGQSLLHIAAAAGNPSIARTLLFYCLDPSEPDNHGETPRSIALEHDNDEFADFVSGDDEIYDCVVAMGDALESQDLDALEESIDEWHRTRGRIENHGGDDGMGTSPPDLDEPLCRMWDGETLEDVAQRTQEPFRSEALTMLDELKGG